MTRLLRSSVKNEHTFSRFINATLESEPKSYLYYRTFQALYFVTSGIHENETQINTN